MTVISLLNQKGGVGKTTLSVHIATALAQFPSRVLLIDADPQGSALDWSAARQIEPLFPVVGLPKPSLPRDVPRFTQYDYIVIDGPPRVNELARAAIMASDLVLIPVQPSPYDIWAAKEIVDLIREAAPFKQIIKSAFVVNRKIVNTAIGRDAQEALAAYPVAPLSTAVCQRVAFADSAVDGRTVLETDPGSAAAQEILSITTEALEFLNHEQENQHSAQAQQRV